MMIMNNGATYRCMLINVPSLTEIRLSHHHPSISTVRINNNNNPIISLASPSSAPSPLSPQSGEESPCSLEGRAWVEMVRERDGLVCVYFTIS
jgi:hypothetical protein